MTHTRREFRLLQHGFGAAMLIVMAGQWPSAAMAQDPAADVAAEAQATLAPGVSYTRVVNDTASEPPAWFISLGIARNAQERSALDLCAGTLGLPPIALQFSWPGETATPYHEVLLGRFASRKDAEASLAGRVPETGCTPGITLSLPYPQATLAPRRYHVVALDPDQFDGMVKVALANGKVAGRAPTSQIARDKGAIVAVNGGFFVMTSEDGVVGDPTSVAIIDGRIESEPTRGRPWIAISNQGQVSASLELSSEPAAPSLQWDDGTTTPLDGINRRPELLRNCGALLEPAARVTWHDQTCLMQNQMVAFTKTAGFLPPFFQNAAYSLIKADGTITQGYRAPQAQELLLVATGERVAELHRLSAMEKRAQLYVPVLGAWPGLFAVGGGPTLLKDGKTYRSETTEGWPFASAPLDQANAMHRWVNLKNPRTAIGVRDDGTILLVVVDGQRNDKPASEAFAADGGATIEELREMMLALGARDALNLDGGGSSTLVINGKVVNTPSDPTGERPVSDAVIVVSKPERGHPRTINVRRFPPQNRKRRRNTSFSSIRSFGPPD